MKDPNELAREIAQIKTMRDQGMTLQHIADTLHRSMGWVCSRHYNKLTPKGSSPELIFVHERLIPFIKSLGHGIAEIGTKICPEPFNFRADLVSTFRYHSYIYEAKETSDPHQIQKAIGQLICYGFFYPPDKNHLVLAIPKELPAHILTDDFRRYLLLHRIEVLEVP